MYNPAQQWIDFWTAYAEGMRQIAQMQMNFLLYK